LLDPRGRDASRRRARPGSTSLFACERHRRGSFLEDAGLAKRVDCRAARDVRARASPSGARWFVGFESIAGEFGTPRRHGAVFRVLHDERRSTVRNAVGQSHGRYDYIASCLRINCEMERALTGSNPELRGMSIVSESRSRSAMMPRQDAQDGVAVRLTRVQARSRGEGEGQCAVTHGLRKLDRPNIQ
jgi:hypothetical protein